MRPSIFISIAVLTLFSYCKEKKDFGKPPVAKVDVVEEEYYGKLIEDPYRYMEDLDDTTVINWFKAQGDYARNILDEIPGRQELIDKLRDFDSRRSNLVFSLSITDNDHYFYLKQTPEDETGKLYHRIGFEGDEELLVDPETYGSDTTKKYTINGFTPTEDGKTLAFGLTANGSEVTTLHIMDVENKEWMDEQIEPCWSGGVSWLPDGQSFIHNRMRSGDVHDINIQTDTRLFWHKLGEEASNDRVILSREAYPALGIRPSDIPLGGYDDDSGRLYGAILSADRRLDIVYAPASDLTTSTISWTRVIEPEDEVQNIGSTDEYLYLYSSKNAPNFQLLRTSFDNLNVKSAEIVIPEHPDATLSGFTLTSDGIYFTRMFNGVEEKLYRLPYDSKVEEEIPLPFTAGSCGLSSKGYEFSDVWVNLTGWTSSSKRYRYILAEKEFRQEQMSSIIEYPEYEDLVVEEVMVPSHDGVEVPLSIIYKKGIKMDGSNPTIFRGYGAYGSSMTPYFSPSLMLWTYKGGILAIAHVRGGGELGDSWHLGGYKTTKPNTWKDLIACTEYMIDKNYTSPEHTAIWSGSAGGILVGRAMTDRPDLYAAVIPEVGSMNTLRMENTPNGPVNVPEFGTVEDSVECMALIEMDSYLHVEDGVEYPATLVTAGMNDRRITAWLPGKFAARLQAANASKNPILFSVDYEAGHGLGDTKTKQFESLADVFSFAFWQTGHPEFQM